MSILWGFVVVNRSAATSLESVVPELKVWFLLKPSSVIIFAYLSNL